MSKITASMLYNLVQCPNRVTLDLFGDFKDRDPVSPFVKLLWEKGNAFEKEIIEGLEISFTDLSKFKGEDKERMTREAMDRGDELIYSGRITAGDLVGEPDILRRHDNYYIAGDIKSGAGEEGASDLEDKKPKKHYAVQLALYTDTLERLGLSGGRVPFVWDIHGEEITYDLNALQGKRNPKSLWSDYQEVLHDAQAISSKENKTLAAYSSKCKLCYWRSVCLKALSDTNDLSLIPDLGRAKRDAMLSHITSLRELAEADISSFISGSKTLFPGIGPDTLKKFQSRAQLQIQSDAKPYVTDSLTLPDPSIEIFFDIETDPMRDICYLHGFVKRKNHDNATEEYVAFFADEPTPEKEKKAFSDAWDYIINSRPSMMYYYSKYERTIWRKLQERYPDVVSKEEIEDLFSPDNSLDLYYDVVKPKTEWPTCDHSIKTLASYLGFKWRDTDPSGASSIEWYHRWVDTGDKT
ncbi:MAG: TM0106 family RecB-like putative nuclease, partial [Planctomycetota bacterium]